MDVYENAKRSQSQSKAKEKIEWGTGLKWKSRVDNKQRLLELFSAEAEQNMNLNYWNSEERSKRDSWTSSDEYDGTTSSTINNKRNKRQVRDFLNENHFTRFFKLTNNIQYSTRVLRLQSFRYSHKSSFSKTEIILKNRFKIGELMLTYVVRKDTIKMSRY